MSSASNKPKTLLLVFPVKNKCHITMEYVLTAITVKRLRNG